MIHFVIKSVNCKLQLVNKIDSSRNGRFFFNFCFQLLFRFYPEITPNSLNVEVGNLLGQKLRCNGNENHFLDCPSSYKNISGQSLTQCDPNESTAGLLCNPPGLVKDGKLSSIEGIPFISIDLEVSNLKY